MSKFVVEYTIKIAKNGDVTNDVVTHGNSFAAVYAAFHQIRTEVDRQITERRQCPYNPAFKGMPFPPLPEPPQPKD